MRDRKHEPGSCCAWRPGVRLSSPARSRPIPDLLRIRDPGGPYAEAMSRAYYAPFAAATGVRVEPVRGGVEPTELVERMVESGDYAWDLALMSDAAHRQLAAAGRLEPHGVDTPGATAIPPARRSAHFLGHDLYATVLACREDAFPAGRAPLRWADLADRTSFPGARALRDHPIDTIEQALLADGTPHASLYPCDLDRAFAALARLAPGIDRWWAKVADAAAWLRDGAVAVSPISNARALALREAGAPVAWSWEEALVSLEGWLIPRGAPGRGLASDFLAFATTPARQAAFASVVAHAPAMPEAVAMLLPARRRALPLDQPGAIAVDQAWWARHKDAVLPRFERWRGETPR